MLFHFSVTPTGHVANILLESWVIPRLSGCKYVHSAPSYIYTHFIPFSPAAFRTFLLKVSSRLYSSKMKINLSPFVLPAQYKSIRVLSSFTSHTGHSLKYSDLYSERWHFRNISCYPLLGRAPGPRADD
jgi:hypothetical protein